MYRMTNTIANTCGMIGLAAALVAALSGPVVVAAAKADMDKVPLTLRGCVVAGDVKNSYILTNVEVDGASVAPSNAFYRFNTTSGLGSQVGYRVEVKGTADLDDPDKGKMKVRVRDGKTKAEVNSEGKRVKTVTADQNLWFGTDGSAKVKADIVTYKFDVEHVQRVPGGTCGPIK